MTDPLHYHPADPAWLAWAKRQMARLLRKRNEREQAPIEAKRRCEQLDSFADVVQREVQK